MNAEKWHHSEIRIAINDESQSSIAKNLRCDELLYYTFMNTFIHQNGRYRQRQYLHQTKTLHATYYVLLQNRRKKMNNIKHLNVHKSRPRSPQSSHREVPIHRTTQHMNGSNINTMRIHVHVGTQTSELI